MGQALRGLGVMDGRVSSGARNALFRELTVLLVKRLGRGARNTLLHKVMVLLVRRVGRGGRSNEWGKHYKGGKGAKNNGWKGEQGGRMLLRQLTVLLVRRVGMRGGNALLHKVTVLLAKREGRGQE